MKSQVIRVRLARRLATAGLLLLCLAVPGRAQDVVINEFMADNKKTLADENGDYSDWIELYNRSVSSVVLTNWYLTDDPADLHKWTFCTNNAVTNIGAGKYMIVFASGKDRSAPSKPLHTNFKLAAAGDYLALVQDTNVVYEYSPVYPPQQADVSYGIGPGDELMYFSPATPGAANKGGVIGVAEDPQFFPQSCLFSNPILVTATTTTAGASIYFTTDCNLPTALSTQYTGRISLNHSAVFRAKAFMTNYKPSGISAYTYISLPDVLRQPANPSGWPTTWGGSTAYYAMDQTVVANYDITNALKVLPTLSLVTAKSNLFDAVYGIYITANLQGSESYERPGTIEWIGTNGTTLFKTDTGVRIQGGAGRTYKKHSFRFLFDGLYGPQTLNSDIFQSPTCTTSFDSFIIRAGWNDAYSAGSAALYFLDECVRRTQIAEGVPGSHGNFVNLYVDGLYWGLYNAAEKPDQHFGATYFGGGSSTNWDYVCQDGAKNGDVNAWNQMIALCQSGSMSNELYQRIQGNNPDRTRNIGYTNYLDMDNYIDYLMPRQWSGDWDWPHNNWHALRNRDNATSGGFRFVTWDAEGWGFGNDKVNPANMTGYWNGQPTLGGGIPYSRLAANAEFKLLFADHVYRHYFNNGALTTNQIIARYTNLSAQIEPVIMAENARWGSSANTLTGWRNVRDNWLTQVPTRTATVLQQYKTYGLYPSIDPPVFNQRGGTFTNGFKVLLTSPGNSIYYTLDGTDPRQYGSRSPVGLSYSGGIPLTYTVKVKTRARSSSGVWSALNEALFIMNGPQPQLRITEVMYHPRPPTGSETNVTRTADDFEFVELRNMGTNTVGLAGTKLTAGITFDFTDSRVTSLGPGEYAVIVKNLAAFTNRYAAWGGIRIAGEYQHLYDFPQGSLSDKGETITLTDATNGTLATFTYSDNRGWPLAADGAGHSLVPLLVEDQTNGALDYGGNWRASAYVDGSPGRADTDPVRDVVLNEVMAHTRYTNGLPWETSNDWIELFNTSSGNIVLNTNWYLSDDDANLRKWAIPPNSISPTNWLTFFESGGFHPATNSGFGINEDGEQVYLSYLPGNTNDRVADCVAFKGQEANRAWGRYPDGGAYWYTTLPTTNAANELAAQPVVISEIMYHPATNALYPVDTGDNEYVELHNPGNVDITLTNEVGAYLLRGGISFTFPTNTTIPAGGYLLVVSFDPATNTAALSTFLNTYWLTNGQVQLVGPYSGRLSDRTDRVAVERPQASETPGNPPSWVIVDEVIYADQAPWPLGCDGGGDSLRRLETWRSGNDPGNWIGSLPTPGLPPVKITLVKPGLGSVLFAPTSVKFTAVIDYGQVAGPVEWVEFWDGTTLLWATNAPPYEYEWNVNTTGTHQVWARMKDGTGTNYTQQYAMDALALVNGSVSNITDISADISGRLMGGGMADVYMCWGWRDGGTNRWDWETVSPVGTIGEGLFSIHAGGIMASKIYYRCYARTAGGEGWAPQSASFNTLSYTNWAQRLAMRVGAYTNSETLYDFPLLVALSTNVSGFTYDAFGGSWYSLRFADELGRRLRYETQSWNTNGTSYVWVRMLELTNNAGLYAWWGNAAVTGAPAYAVDGSVWTPGYDGVWHLEPGLAESSGLGQAAEDHGSTAVAGAVAQGRRFDGTGTYVAPPVTNSWYSLNRDHLTVSFWVKPEVDANGATPFGAEALNYDPGGSPSNRSLYVSMYISRGLKTWMTTLHDSGRVLDSYTLGQWQLLTVVLSNGTAYASVNDKARWVVGSYSDIVLPTLPVLGKRNGSTNTFRGSVDEFRVARVARSAAWTKAEYQTMMQPGGFIQYGPVGPAAESNPDANGNGLPDVWEQTYFGSNSGPLAAPDADWDGDRLSNLGEYIAGTDPTNAASVFALSWTNVQGQMVPQFDALPAAGAGYEGRQRIYDLYYSPDLTSTQWLIVPGYSNLPGNNTFILCTNPSPAVATNLFFHVHARLQ